MPVEHPLGTRKAFAWPQFGKPAGQTDTGRTGDEGKPPGMDRQRGIPSLAADQNHHPTPTRGGTFKGSGCRGKPHLTGYSHRPSAGLARPCAASSEGQQGTPGGVTGFTQGTARRQAAWTRREE